MNSLSFSPRCMSVQNFIPKIKSKDHSEISKLWAVIEEKIFSREERFSVLGSTTSNEQFHSLLYTSQLLNKAVTYSPVQHCIAIHMGVIWHNNGEDHTIQAVSNYAGITVSPTVKQQIISVQNRKKNHKKKFTSEISGSKRRAEKALEKENTKRLVRENPEFRHTNEKSPCKKKRKTLSEIATQK
jgi:hypothetical protein